MELRLFLFLFFCFAHLCIKWVELWVKVVLHHELDCKRGTVIIAVDWLHLRVAASLMPALHGGQHRFARWHRWCWWWTWWWGWWFLYFLLSIHLNTGAVQVQRFEWPFGTVWVVYLGEFVVHEGEWVTWSLITGWNTWSAREINDTTDWPSVRMPRHQWEGWWRESHMSLARRTSLTDSHRLFNWLIFLQVMLLLLLWWLSMYQCASRWQSERNEK